MFGPTHVTRWPLHTAPRANLVCSQEAQHSSAKSPPQPCSKQRLAVGAGDLTLPISSYPTSSNAFRHPALHSGVSLHLGCSLPRHLRPAALQAELPSLPLAAERGSSHHVWAFSLLSVTGSICKSQTLMIVIVYANR